MSFFGAILQPVVNHVIPAQLQISCLVAMRRLYAGSLSYDTTEEEIKELFESYGEITSLTMSYDVEKKHHKGFAFVEYATAEAAALALKKLKGVTLNDRRMKLGRPQAALRYQTLLAQLEMDGRASARVYLGNLPKDVSLEKIESVCRQFGGLKSLCKDSQRSAFVEFDSLVAAELIQRRGQKVTLCGNEISIGQVITPLGLPIPRGSSFNNTSSNSARKQAHKRKRSCTEIVKNPLVDCPLNKKIKV
ncbi:unnamed protein product [Oikopleura dioica]|uniref:RRM domain-containing protein n=1 Tax=Oikopleura dioica TaxID=34765 RepID=E4WTI7_OIKDI|nr:unnamed protein product [Oikopleura dioica]